MDDYSHIQQNIERIMSRIDKAATQAHRDIDSIKLLLATKTRTPKEINTAIALGYGLIGENRAQELEEKHPYILKTSTKHMPRETHFIGSLQGNKVNEVTALSDCIQSVDRIRIARRIHNYSKNNHLKKNILIQVNTSFEESKYGLHPNELFSFLEEMMQFDHIIIKGFMTIGLNSDNETQIRKGFAQLRELNRQSIEQGLLLPTATELSMGMSQDLDLAILEGATILRVGTDIFGKR